MLMCMGSHIITWTSVTMTWACTVLRVARSLMPLQGKTVWDNQRYNSKLYWYYLMWTLREQQLDHPSERIAKTTQIRSGPSEFHLCDSIFHHILSHQLYKATYQKFVSVFTYIYIYIYRLYLVVYILKHWWV